MTYSKGCCRFVIAVSVMSLVEISISFKGSKRLCSGEDVSHQDKNRTQEIGE